MVPGNKSSAGPPHSQMDAAGFNLSLPPPHGGTVPDPTTSIGRLWHCFARPAPNNNSGVTPPGPRTTATAMTPGNKSSAGPPHSKLRRVRLAGTNAGFNLLLPPPLGGTVPDPPIAFGGEHVFNDPALNAMLLHYLLGPVTAPASSLLP